MIKIQTLVIMGMFSPFSMARLFLVDVESCHVGVGDIMKKKTS